MLSYNRKLWPNSNTLLLFFNFFFLDIDVLSFFEIYLYKFECLDPNDMLCEIFLKFAMDFESGILQCLTRLGLGAILKRFYLYTKEIFTFMFYNSYIVLEELSYLKPALSQVR